MFGFLIKKSFCDGWDNLLSLFLVNVINVFVGFAFFFLFYSIAQSEWTWAFILAAFLLIFVFTTFAFAYGEIAAKIADFDGVKFLDYFKYIPGVLKDALLFSIMICVISVISVICLNYYFLQQQSTVGFFMGAIIIWLDVFLFLSLMWFVPIRATMHNNFRKVLRKCFIIFFDNTGFTVAMFIYNLVLFAISVFFIGMMPGMTGILIANCNALRLRLYKYDYLEEHPELKTKAERRKIPWEELIYEDRETLGPRKFKSFLFPWKEEER